MNKETKIRARPAAITLTPEAEERIAELMGRAPEGAIGVKLSTPRRGCSGLAYSVDYVTEEQAFDEKIATPGGNFYVDGASVLYLVGSTMDWVEDDFGKARGAVSAPCPPPPGHQFARDPGKMPPLRKLNELPPADAYQSVLRR